MYIRIHNAADYKNGNYNSCGSLVSYLEKENEIEGLSLEDRKLFFDHTTDMVPSSEVVNRIDNNVAKLSKNESRYYMISINPSQSEMQHIAKKVTGRNVTDPSQMTPREIKSFDKSMQDYSRVVMSEYADGFNKNLSGNDIVYFGKVEHERKYNRLSDEVKSGEKKDGDLKEGFQSHVHIVVSRKDQTNKIRLSPFANHKNSKNTLNGKQVQIGFNRKEFVQRSEKKFDEHFNYNRHIKQSFKYRHSTKNMAASVARSYANQLTGGVYFKVLSVQNMAKQKDPLKALTGVLHKNVEYRTVVKVAKMAVRPEKIILEVVKKLPASIARAATLKL